MRVPTTAGFDPGFELMPHQEVKFQPVAITTTGYMYVWVSNESEDTKVWFDDLAITQSQDIVTQATDYGVWGDVLREQKTNVLDEYRYGYQGQFAEKDEETGWNHFELREYDAVIARWLIPDPARQYFSPYEAFGNNPITRFDSDGGFSGPPSFFFNSFIKAIFKNAENEAQFNFESNVKGTTDYGLGVDMDAINLTIHTKYESIGNVLFTLNGQKASAQVKWNGGTKAISSFTFIDKTLFGPGEIKNTIIFYGGEGGVVGYLSFDSRKDFLNFSKGYKNYVNALLLDKVKAAGVQDVRTDKKSQWIEFLESQGADLNFRIENVRDEPTFWDKLMSIFTGTNEE